MFSRALAANTTESCAAAVRTIVRSGAPSDSGVGRHRMMTSASPSGAGFALNVARSMASISESATSTTCDRLAVNTSIFPWSVSIPSEGNPA